MAETGGAPGENAPPTAEALLAWYDRARRDLPWRAPPGARPDPYAVWLAEVMLQQTVAAAVAPRFRRFLETWPDVRALAAADREAVMRAWAGLGYYARARNLHACAKAVAERHGGEFPRGEAALRALPGIGAYTAAAISAIAFDEPAAAVDGNVERVMARVFAVDEPLPGARRVLRAHAAGLTPRLRPGDYAQAVMELGATVCRPRNPRCGECPWRGACRARALGTANALPRRAPRPPRPLRRGVAFWILRGDGAALFERRPDRGLLGGTLGLPSTEWTGTPPVRAAPPVPALDLRALPGAVEHGFTHFRLELRMHAGRARPPAADGIWLRPGDIDLRALPTLTRKLVVFARESQGGRA